MTKEELEKDYYADRPTEPYSDDDSPNDWANIAHYAEENLEKAFKRIAEHEFTNKKISDECHKLVDTLEKKQNENELLETQNIKLQAEVSRLTIKNAELKDEWQEQVQKATDEGYARTLQTIQLSKAKEIIKKYLAIGVGGKITQNYLDVTKEAEQFIKENK